MTMQIMTLQGAAQIFFSGRDDDDRSSSRKTAGEGGDETEGRRRIRFRPRADFMHGAEGQSALRQTGINARDSQSYDAAVRPELCLFGHQTAQFLDDFGPLSAHK